VYPVLLVLTYEIDRIAADSLGKRQLVARVYAADHGLLMTHPLI
jgi:hypothetical protein